MLTILQIIIVDNYTHQRKEVYEQRIYLHASHLGSYGVTGILIFNFNLLNCKITQNNDFNCIILKEKMILIMNQGTLKFSAY